MAGTTRATLKSFFRGQQTGAATPHQELGFGLHTLVAPKHQNDPNAIDIVAIHGVNGHYAKTWTHEATGFNWIHESIPKELPESRVMTFSYNSAVQFSKSNADFFVFADQLLECLLTERSSPAEASRPLIFICHSLGGLVFKRALTRSYENERYTTIYESVAGVMFFGTPHRGASLASWGNLLGKLVKTAFLGTSTNTQLTEDLKPGSRILDHTSKAFPERAGDLKIFSFYE